MSLWFLLFLLLGIGVLVYGAVMFAFGKRRNAGITFGVAAILLGISAPIGVLIGDGAPVTAATAPASTMAGLAFFYPAEAEKLDAQDYLLTGTAAPLEPLEVLQNGVSFGSIAAGADGAWSYYVAKPAVGEYEYAQGLILLANSSNQTQPCQRQRSRRYRTQPVQPIHHSRHIDGCTHRDHLQPRLAQPAIPRATQSV